MKKNQILSFFLALSLIVGMLAAPAAAATGSTASPTPTATASAETESAETKSAETESAASETDDADAPFVPTSEKLTLATGAEGFDPVDAEAALLIDENTLTVLYEQDADKEVYPASLTKVMTALLVFEAIDRGELSLDTVVTVDSTVTQGIPSDGVKQDLVAGEKISVEDLLYCMLVASANDAANALAVAVSGSIEDFVDDMNTRAAELGCTDTYFTNPTGIHSEDMHTTCYDLYYITEAAWQYSEFRTIVDTADYTVEATNRSKDRRFFNTNALLSEKLVIGFTYKYAVGVKTGSTDQAGQCLIAAAEYNDRTLFSIVMGCVNGKDEDGETTRPAYTETRRMFRHGFLDFNAYTVVSADELVCQLPVILGKDTDYVLLSPENDVAIEMIAGVPSSDFSRVMNIPDSVKAPIKAGDVIGTMDLYYKDELKASVNLVAVSGVDLSLTEQGKYMITSLFNNIFVKILLVLVGVAVLVLAGIIASAFLRKDDRRSRGTHRKKTTPSPAPKKKPASGAAPKKRSAKPVKKSGNKNQ